MKYPGYPAVIARMSRHNQERERLAHLRDPVGGGIHAKRPGHLTAKVTAEVIEGMAAKEGELAQAAAGGTLT